MTSISPSDYSGAMTYSAFRMRVDELLGKNQTTGEDHSPAMLDYTRQNVQRMNKWDKIFRLSDDSLTRIRGIQRRVVLLTLTEAWCGDAAQVIPVLARIAEAGPMVDLQLILRDEHPELMGQFLTNGAQAIPKVIILDAETREVLDTWGPRPSEAQAMVMDMKETVKILPEGEQADFRQRSSEAMHAWYARDKGQRVQIEFLNTLMPLVRMEVSVVEKVKSWEGRSCHYSCTEESFALRCSPPRTRG